LEEARELVPGAPAVATSARTGAGLDELREALAGVAARVERRDRAQATRLFLDRVFTLRGIGTVATGTLWSGSVGDGDVLAVEPGGRRVRIRSVQVHDHPVERAAAGQRVAVSLPGVERRELERGHALVEPGAFPVSYRLDVALTELAPIADGTRLHVHHGTAEHLARVVRAGERYAQIRLVTPAVAARGDRLVLRERTTVGGALVLDPRPPRHADPRRFALLERGEIEAVVHAPVHAASLRHLLGDEPRELERAGEWLFSRAWLEELRSELDARLTGADPLDPGVPAPAEPWLRDVLALLPFELRGGRVYRPGRAAELGERAEAAAELERTLEEAGFEPVRVEDPALARYLEGEGRLVRLGDGLALGRAAYDDARRLLSDECARAGSIRLARFRDLLGTGRRPAQLLLERFDADGLTRRLGDERVLRRRHVRA
ncbi:MAG: SelB C-terminal domain-containing protein, partial [Thermoleophilia bacterium]|nr:SelB C-terminal domain-containing protein [Thermoleophilia bacterium]